MADLWLSNTETFPGNSAGAMNGDGSRKLLLHSTEGSTIEGAVSAYRANNSWPTLTVDCRRRRIAAHLPLNVAARALRNNPGGADETNRDGTILVQIELVGSAGRPETIGGPDDLDWFGRHVVAPIAALTGVPLVSTVDWAPYPTSYGKGAAQRLTPAAWDAYSGVLGHQHAPDNSHGDPGAIDIDRILTAARGGDDMPTIDEIRAAVRDVVREELARDNDAAELLVKATGSPHWYALGALGKRHIDNREEAASLVFAGKLRAKPDGQPFEWKPSVVDAIDDVATADTGG